MLIMELAKKLVAAGKAVVLVLHDLSLALQTADLVGVMSRGEIVRSGSVDEIYDSGVLDEVFGVKVCRMEMDGGCNYYFPL